MASTPEVALDKHAQATLTAMARALYPHDFLDDSPYRRVVDIVAEEGGAARRTLLAEGVAALDAVVGRSFVDLSEKEKVTALYAIEGSQFFEVVRAATARHLYDNRALWPRFGYEGASSHLGGYIERGFDDLDWISEDEVEAEADR
ncbi:MAG: gluconate 2-dehydrogenase subunit 3 family protein [Rhodospirillaceae bacterium]|nr:gluconate 2-dehydrogenase subunit 3 family protein [Rhodospirillaceae bacterium]